jgi:hypothetical protein
MRRAFGFTGAWLMTTAMAMGVSWLGCAVVLNGTSAPAPTVTADLQAVDAAHLPAPTSTTSYPLPQSAGTGRALPPRTSAPPRSSRGTRPPTTPGSPTGLPDTIPIVTLHARPPDHVAPPAPVPASATPTAGPQPKPELHEFSTAAGQAWIGFSTDGVAVLSLHPSDGYEWYIKQDNPGALLLILTQDGREFDLYAAWDGGPTAAITEYRW